MTSARPSRAAGRRTSRGSCGRSPSPGWRRPGLRRVGRRAGAARRRPVVLGRARVLGRPGRGRPARARPRRHRRGPGAAGRGLRRRRERRRRRADGRHGPGGVAALHRGARPATGLPRRAASSRCRSTSTAAGLALLVIDTRAPAPAGRRPVRRAAARPARPRRGRWGSRACARSSRPTWTRRWGGCPMSCRDAGASRRDRDRSGSASASASLQHRASRRSRAGLLGVARVDAGRLRDLLPRARPGGRERRGGRGARGPDDRRRLRRLGGGAGARGRGRCRGDAVLHAFEAAPSLRRRCSRCPRRPAPPATSDLSPPQARARSATRIPAAAATMATGASVSLRSTARTASSTGKIPRKTKWTAVSATTR